MCKLPSQLKLGLRGIIYINCKNLSIFVCSLYHISLIPRVREQNLWVVLQRRFVTKSKKSISNVTKLWCSRNKTQLSFKYKMWRSTIIFQTTSKTSCKENYSTFSAYSHSMVWFKIPRRLQAYKVTYFKCCQTFKNMVQLIALR